MQKDPNDGRMITIPPRLRGLRLQQSTFRSLIEPILWNYILESKSIDPWSVCHVQMIVGSNHGDTAFQFGALVLIELEDGCHLDFEVMVCKLICRKDSGHLLEETILERLAQGLDIISTFELHLFIDEQNSIVAEFHEQCNLYF
jgi:hypothetical protein